MWYVFDAGGDPELARRLLTRAVELGFSNPYNLLPDMERGDGMSIGTHYRRNELDVALCHTGRYTVEKMLNGFDVPGHVLGDNDLLLTTDAYTPGPYDTPPPVRGEKPATPKQPRYHVPMW